MIARMSKVEIVGQKDRLQDVLAALQDLGVFQLEAAGRDAALPLSSEATDQRTVFERLFLEDLLEKIDQLLARLPDVPLREIYIRPRAAIGTVAYTIEHHLQACRTFKLRKDALLEQRAEIGRYIGFLGTLSSLSAEAHVSPDIEVIGLTLKDQAALERIRSVLAQLTGGRYKLFTVPAGDGTLSGLITVERELAGPVSASLTEEKVPEMSLPSSFAGLPLPGRLSFLEARVREIDREVADIDREVRTLGQRWAPIYRSVRSWIAGRLDLLRAAASIRQTQLCFDINGWLPSRDVERLRQHLGKAFGKTVAIEEKAVSEKDLTQVPSVLRNPAYFRPYEIFTRLLPVPRYASYDPTPFIGIFFPLFFGMILGDAGYGLLLAAAALVLSRRRAASALVRDAGRILLSSSIFTILFGVLYGEFFGDLPRRLFGIEPLLFERSTAIIPMFVFALSVGVVHILFGLALGAVTAFRKHEKREGIAKVLDIVIIAGMVAAAAASFGYLPVRAARPVVLTILFLLPFLLLTGGLLAPLELLKSVGNIISYIRITAIGMTSVLLAYVANELAGLTGDVVSGIVVAGLLHALNIVLGVFSPTIHALRLHFVEFFGKFIEPGGKPFTPLKKD